MTMLARIRLYLAFAALCGTLGACGDIPTAVQRTPAGDAGRQVNSALAVDISGTEYIYNEGPETFTWTASATGGTASYSYQWQFRYATHTNWANVGTNSSTYSREVNSLWNHPSFVLRVIVTSNGATASADHAVEVQGPPMCGGVLC